MSAIRRINMKVFSDGSVVSDTSAAGYIGEHLATELLFDLPERLRSAGFVYTLNFEDGNGNISVGTVNRSSMSFVIPMELTYTNTLRAELVIMDNSEMIFKSNVFILNLQNAVEITGEVQNRYEGLLEDTLEKFQELTDQIGTADISQFRGIVSVEKTGTSGDSSVYTITYTDDTTSTFSVENGSSYILTQSDREDIAEIVFESYISDSNARLENFINGGDLKGNS